MLKNPVQTILPHPPIQPLNLGLGSKNLTRAEESVLFNVVFEKVITDVRSYAIDSRPSNLLF